MATDDLAARVKAIQERAATKRTQAGGGDGPPPSTAEPTPARPSPQRWLPLWSDATRGVPNGILRSALFGAIRRGRRRAMDGELVASVDGVTVKYTGWRLDQADLDVWEQAAHLAREQPLGDMVMFTAHAFLKAIGRCTGSKDHEWLKVTFRRLTASAVEITIDGKTYVGSLIQDYYRDETTGHYILQLNPKILALWDTGWTALDWDTRKALKNQPLALWLHGFYSTHAEAHPMRVKTLHRLCGSECQRLRRFREELRQALEQLRVAGGIQGWEITAQDLVNIKGCPSDSQVRHLVRKACKGKRDRPPKGTG